MVGVSLSIETDLFNDIEDEMKEQDAMDKKALLWKRSPFYVHLLRLGLSVEKVNQQRKA